MFVSHAVTTADTQPSRRHMGDGTWDGSIGVAGLDVLQNVMMH